MTRVATLVERSRYAQKFTDEEATRSLPGMAHDIRRGIAQPQSRWRQVRAFLAPEVPVPPHSLTDPSTFATLTRDRASLAAFGRKVRQRRVAGVFRGCSRQLSRTRVLVGGTLRWLPGAPDSHRTRVLAGRTLAGAATSAEREFSSAAGPLHTLPGAPDSRRTRVLAHPSCSRPPRAGESSRQRATPQRWIGLTVTESSRRRASGSRPGA